MSDWKKVEMGEAWTPEKKGDEIIGILTDVQDAVGPNSSRMYTLHKEGDETINVWGSTVLDNKMRSVMIGEEVRIVYLGMAKSEQRKGAEYKNWEVYHRDPPKEDENVDYAGPDDIKF